MKIGVSDGLALRANLPGEAMPQQSVVELIGDSRVLVENHKGVCGYSCNRIVIKVAYGQLYICGSDLVLACMTKQQLVITGRISEIAVQKGV